jgi:hypothetical protein
MAPSAILLARTRDRASHPLVRFVRPSPRLPIHLLLPAAAAAAALLVVSVFAFGSAFRPGIVPEILLVLYLSYLISLVQRHRLIAAILATLAVFTVYAASIMKWVAFDEPLLLADVGVIPELSQTVGWGWRALAALVSGAAATALIANLRRPSRRETTAFFPVLAFGLLSIAAPGACLAVLDLVRPDIYWRPVSRVWRAGPIYSLARQIPESIRIRRGLERVGGPVGRLRAPELRGVPQPPNVHLIVMESLLDPRNVRTTPFDSDPMDSRLRRWIDESASLGLAPTFGGQTARAEFELLCGVPSYAALGVEMNLIERPVPCLPRLLHDAGYLTWASVPVAPSFFRVGRAYPALGFDERFFRDSFDVSDMDGLWLSDASTFRQTLARLSAHPRNGRPIFDYIVTTAGHEPFERNAARRPPVFRGNGWLPRMANTVHYSSQAVADFVETIEDRDPDAIVMIVGDHLPIFGTANGEFLAAGYRLGVPGRGAAAEWSAGSLATRATPLVVRRGRRPIRVGIAPHYTLGETLLDSIAEGAYCRAHECARQETVIYRPFGTEPAFAVASAFPERACTSSHPDDADCQRAWRAHDVVRRAYDGLLAAAIRH